MNDIAKSMFDALNTELSPITAKMIIEEKCKMIGKDPETITKEDIKALITAIMGPVLLFGGEEKARSIKKKLEDLT